MHSFQRFFLEVMFNCVKMAAFQLYLQLGKQRKIGWVGEETRVALVKNLLVKKEV
jgi:hypothetical protein